MLIPQIPSLLLLQEKKFSCKFKSLISCRLFLLVKTLGQCISNNIEKGEIKYNLLSSWYIKPEKKQLLIERLKILFFHNEKEINGCLKALTEKI